MTDYAKTVQELLDKGETVETLNKANHILLDQRTITMKEFREAAQILAKVIINR